MEVTLDVFRNEPDTEQHRAGTVLFREGERGESMFVILDGQVELRVNGTMFETLGPGGVLGEMALIDQSPRVATAVALTDVSLARIPEKRFLFMVRETPHFALQIMRLMADRLRRMVNRI
jgi:CRP/FNR family transcriptional regulator, cyclic AMP receptor protein